MLKENIRNELNQTYTQNYDLAYKSTLNYNLDFFALASSLRNEEYKDYPKLKELLDRAYTEDKILAIKNIFFLRDVRNGNKERDLGRFALTYVANNDPKVFKKIIPYIAEIGRWDDLVQILCATQQEKAKKDIAKVLYKQLQKDVKSKTPTLLAKWLPTVDAGKKANAQAKIIVKQMNIDKYVYHRMVKDIRKKLNLLETKIVEENFEKIDYSKVASQAMLKNKSLFLNKDSDHFKEYLKDLKNNKITAKTQTITPPQLVKQALRQPIIQNFRLNESLTKEEKNFINLNWRDLKRDYTDKNIIVVRDGSASMWGNPIIAASALAIYSSECLKGQFKDSFITFSSRPELVEFPKNAKTLTDKIQFLQSFDDWSTTDIEKVYNTILKASIGIPKGEQIDTIVIVSDMQFNYVESSEKESTYENAKRKFEEQNVKFPHIVFWNVDCKTISTPASNNDNVSLVSGFSTELFEEIIKNDVKSPEERMLNVLSRYDYLNKILKKLATQ